MVTPAVPVAELEGRPFSLPSRATHTHPPPTLHRQHEERLLPAVSSHQRMRADRDQQSVPCAGAAA